MFIRPYTPDDLEAAIAVFRSNIPRYFRDNEEPDLRQYLSEHLDGYFVGELNGEVVAAGGFALNADRSISLCWGMVRADVLGTGLGKRITKFRIRAARKKFGPLEVIVSTSQHTKGFYEKLGFELVEQLSDGFAPGLDTCKMVLRPLATTELL